MIPFDARENANCAPLARGVSPLAGARLLRLAWLWGVPRPRAAELVDMATLICAVVLLSRPGRLAQRLGPARVETT